MQSIRVGFCSQDSTLQMLLSSALSPEFQLFLIADPSALNRLLAIDDCPLFLVDLSSTDPHNEERLQTARELIANEHPCVILADAEQRSAATSLVRQGAHGYCHRPPSMRDLKLMLRRAHENAALRQHTRTVSKSSEPTRDCGHMVGSGAQMQEIYRQVRSVANIDASVLVTGESGTGKELVAQAIHNTGSRSTRPFVAVACGAIPETLIEAELFGHEKGAFTGSVGPREGYFEQAADGTLFLDEIGDLSLYTQVKLLRVLQQREFSRLGSTKLIPLRARLVFATHRDLAELVAEGKFRQDLYYRINVMGIEMPSLQERVEDIPQIAEHFLRLYSQVFHKQIDQIEPKAIAALQRYPWPGNVRELENVIQRAIIVSEGTALRIDDLPLHLQQDSVIGIEGAFADGSFERQLHDYKVKLANAAVRQQHGNKTQAARSLCISRAYLHRLIRSETGPSLALVGGSSFDGAEPICASFG